MIIILPEMTIMYIYMLLVLQNIDFINEVK